MPMVVCQELSTGCVECFDQSGTVSAASTCPNIASYSNGGKLSEINEKVASVQLPTL